MKRFTITFCLFLTVFFEKSLSFEFGSQRVNDACRNMRIGYSGTPQAKKPPFHFLIYKEDGSLTSEYRLRHTLTVKLVATGDERISQFMIQARRWDQSWDQSQAVGFFSKSDGTKQICSTDTGNVLIDEEPVLGDTREPWKELTLYWTPPSKYLGHLEFRVTMMTNFQKIWIAEKSEILKQYGLPIPTTTQAPRPTEPAGTRVSPISTAECGNSKGCYRHPKDCTENYCHLIATWQDKGDSVVFELGADSEGWVALGFSHDKKMGDDIVLECAWNETEEYAPKVDVRHSVNYEDKKNKVMGHKGFLQYGGKRVNGRLRCFFEVPKEPDNRSPYPVIDLDLTDSYYFFLADGKVDDRGNKKRHTLDTHKDPLVSKHKVNVRDNLDMHGRARYGLVKAHGCLMIFAWMVCASIAIILARYYKLMWPQERVCGRLVWFAFHRLLNLIAMFCTILAFILIFIHAGGYSKMPDLPACAHPILGIIVTILCILNPCLAACRCKPKTRKRPIFNWIHWLFGTIAHVLATPAMFIGLSLPKAHVPWWATWVMVAFMLYHLLTELLLEIHGCINSRKQKQRDLEYELQKLNNKLMEGNKYRPPPVGTRFKRTVLILYLIVAICLGLVMIITVAAG